MTYVVHTRLQTYNIFMLIRRVSLSFWCRSQCVRLHKKFVNGKLLHCRKKPSNTIQTRSWIGIRLSLIHISIFHHNCFTDIKQKWLGELQYKLHSRNVLYMRKNDICIIVLYPLNYFEWNNINKDKLRHNFSSKLFGQTLYI